MNGQISQIPGLSPVVIIPPEEKTQRQRGIVKESDSEYIKLAKRGGHKGLLWHEEQPTPKVTPYKPPDWFIPMPVENSSSKMQKGPGGFLPVEPPFGNDNLSAWERDNMVSTANEELIPESNQNQRKMVTFQPIDQEDEAPMFKRTVKRQSPVDMAKLLSFGYAESDRPKSGFNE